MTQGFRQSPSPITLSGHGVSLLPLLADHADALEETAADGRLWELRVTSVPEPGGAAAYIQTALQGQAAGHMLPFAIVETNSGRVIGTSRYHDIVPNLGRDRKSTRLNSSH